MTNLATIIVVLTTNYVVTESHYVEYMGKRTLIHQEATPTPGVWPATNKIAFYSNLSGRAEAEALRDVIFVHPIKPTTRPPPLPPGMEPSLVEPPPPPAFPPPVGYVYSTNWFKHSLNTNHYIISDWVNFRNGHTYELQLENTLLTDPWVTKATVTWTFGNSTIWRATTDNNKPHAFIRFKDITP